MIPGSANPLLLATAAGAGGYEIERSLRFNSADSAYLSRTPASAGNRKTWTWAGWVKKTTNGGDYKSFFTAFNSTSAYTALDFADTDALRITAVGGGSMTLVTSAVYRDPSSWYHVVVAVDTTQATASNRAKVYVNGTEITTFGAATYPGLNTDTEMSTAVNHQIGRNPYPGFSQPFNGYLADIHFIDGQALTPSSFTTTDANGELQPKAYTGTYGTNGFRLDFSDNSAATATTLGKDRVGSNNWTPNNLSVTAGAGNDSLVDTPTSYGTDTGAGGSVRGNYCTWGANYAGAAGLSNGNLDFLAPATQNAFGSISFTTGKWYWEITNSGTGLSYVGIMDSTITSATDTTWSSQSRAYVSGGSKYDGSSTSYGAPYAAGDVIGFALDLDSNTLTFYKNGTSQGVAFSSGLIGKEWKPFVYGSSGSGCSANFGQRPFAYTAPSGFKALCDTNLPAPTIAKGSTVMDVKLYTGNGGTQSISGLGFSPDLVWLKGRSVGYSHQLYDQVRGAGKLLNSNSTSAEATVSDNLTAFTSDGFSLGSDAGTNQSSATYVAWCFDAGTTTTTNTVGSITSQVRANASAGFSVVTYTGTGSNATVGHGLNVAPRMLLVKSRSASNGWGVYHESIGNTYGLILNSTSAVSGPNGTYWNSTSPTSTVFSLGTDSWGNASGGTYVCYAFSPVVGYSSAFSFTGNGSSDGPFCFLGFRPRFLVIKRTDAAYGWYMYDTARDTYNIAGKELLANASDAEVSDSDLDILSNGFKPRRSSLAFNASGGTFIGFAWAENPFQYARAR